MLGVAYVGCSISGMTTGTHHYHYEDGTPIYDDQGNIIGYNQDKLVYDPAVPISGTISSGSSRVLIGSSRVAYVGSTTSESDAYDSGVGHVSGGSSRVLIGSVGVARNTDVVTPHNGSASISSGSNRVFA